LEKKPAATQKKRAATPQAQPQAQPQALKELPPVNSSEVKNETQPTD